MIDAKFADAQIKRLAGLDFFPTGKDAVAELSMALRVADTEPIAKLVVDGFLANETQCPKPSQMRQAAYAENERIAIQEETPKPPPRSHCADCHDTGITESIGADDLRSIAAQCACDAGRSRARRIDPYSPERVNAARAVLRKLAIVPSYAGLQRRPHSLATVTDILKQIDAGRVQS